MAQAKLDLVIGITDKATSGIGRITGAIGGLGKAAAFGGIGLATGAIAGLSTALIGGIGDARDAGLVFAQTEAVIKSTGGAAGFTAEQISDMAASYSLAEGKSMFGDDDIQKGQNLLLTFTNITEQLPAATGVMVDMATAMGTDVSGGAIQLGKALNDPIKGISALSRVGVTFTEEQKNQIKVMQESGDMAGAQGIILAELNKEFGGSAQAAAAAAGPMVMFKERMGELAESVGAQVLPLLDRFGAWLTSPEIMGGIEAGIGAAVNWITTVAIPALTTGFTFLTTNVLPILQTAFTTVWPIIQTAVATVYNFLSTVVWPWMQTVAFPWLTTVALPALQTAFTTVWPIIQQAVNAVYTFLSTVVWPWLRDVAFPWITNTAMPALVGAWQTAWPLVQAAVQAVYDWLSGTAWPWLRDVLWPKLKELATDVQAGWSVAWPLIKGAVEAVYTWLSGTVWPWFRDTLWPKLKELATDVQAGWAIAWPAIQQAVKVLYDWLLGTVWPWFRDTLWPKLKELATDVQAGWEEAWPLIKGAVETAYTWIKDTAWPWFEDNITKLKDWVNTVQEGWDTAFGLMKGYVSDLKTGWDTLKNGISAAVDLIKGYITDFKNALSGIKDALPEWMVPGSPTPLEIGLRGIADAARTVGPALRSAFGMIGSNGMPGIEIATTLSHLMEAAKWGVLGQEAGKKLLEGVADGWLDTVDVAMPKMVDGIASTLRRILESAGFGAIGKTPGQELADGVADGWRDGIDVAMPTMVSYLNEQLRNYMDQHGNPFIGNIGSGAGRAIVEGGINTGGGGMTSTPTPFGPGKGVQAAGVVNNFSMTINTSASYEPIVQDYRQMASIVGRG